ncbi:hypothetical protein MUK51_19955 [Sphingobacterium faecium]|jgi:hypothetical protein|uniref:hypothetical protein n=1 Tax=Sphingobacterium faecium TaxID=34087 RepID=UPI0021B596FE|nr:hypothetical protein [Sphingobacterium faecium]UXD69438.1 hypothetical protein MUK51_19955 [Sphingobacterium faecium]
MMMEHIFKEDFRDFQTALNKDEVRSILVGGCAVILHGYFRKTDDKEGALLWRTFFI